MASGSWLLSSSSSPTSPISYACGGVQFNITMIYVMIDALAPFAIFNGVDVLSGSSSGGSFTATVNGSTANYYYSQYSNSPAKNFASDTPRYFPAPPCLIATTISGQYSGSEMSGTIQFSATDNPCVSPSQSCSSMCPTASIPFTATTHTSTWPSARIASTSVSTKCGSYSGKTTTTSSSSSSSSIIKSFLSLSAPLTSISIGSGGGSATLLTPLLASIETPVTVGVSSATTSTLTATDVWGRSTTLHAYTAYDVTGPTPNITLSHYTNQTEASVIISFSEEVVGVSASSLLLSPSSSIYSSSSSSSAAASVTTFTPQLLSWGSGEIFTYALTLTGEGNTSVRLGTAITDVAGNAIVLTPPPSPSPFFTSSWVVRDVTPPNATLTPLNGSVVSGNRFWVQIDFSEPVTQVAVGGISITVTRGMGDAGLTPLQWVSPTRSLALVDSLAGVPTNGETPPFTVTLTVLNGSATDYAGNPISEVSVPVEVNLPNIPTELPSSQPQQQPQAKFGSATDIGLIVAAVVVLLIGIFVCGWWVCGKKKKHVPARVAVENPSPLDEDFDREAREVFQMYGPMNGQLTYDKIVEYGVQNGFGQKKSKKAAKRMLREANGGYDSSILSEEDFVMWLKGKITKGSEVRPEHLEELRAQFSQV